MGPRRPIRLLLTAVAVSAAAAVPAGGAAAIAGPGWSAPVSVTTPAHPALHGPLRIGFSPRALPHGGFYYAVLVLSKYPTSGGQLPRCAISSDMGKTEYGFPSPGRRLRLSVLSARSEVETWCPTGHYLGAVYAVPHRPRCSYSQPCYGHTTQVGPCWIVGEGKRVCGVVALRPYSYPGGLPRPLDSASRVVARFSVTFPAL